jgi:thioredoxin-related protein
MTYLTMKKTFLFLGFILIANCTFGQIDPNIQNIPPFRILRTDSTWFTPADIKKHKPVMIIYFSPDCSHCQQLMQEIKPEIRKFGDTQIIMITYIQPAMLSAVRAFYREFGLAKYRNVTVGTEGYTLLVQRYFHIAITPYIAVFNRNGKFIKGFAKPPAMKELISATTKA